MAELDYYASVGFALALLAKSRYHRQYRVGNYFETEIFPAFLARQVRFYMTEEGEPTAMVTWAWLSEEVEADIHETGRALTHTEWKCGDRLFFNDWITPYRNTREVLLDMMENIFPTEPFATSLKRNQDGSVRYVNRWTRSYADRAGEILKRRKED